MLDFVEDVKYEVLDFEEVFDGDEFEIKTRV